MKDDIYDDVYGSSQSSAGLPKNEFPADERNPRIAYAAIRDELMLIRTVASEFCDVTSRIAASAGRASWATWVEEAFQRGAGRMHRHTSVQLGWQPFATVASADGLGTSDPRKLLEQYAGELHDCWQAVEEPIPLADGPREALSKVTPLDIRQAALSFSETTAEAVEMQKCLQLRLQKKNSKSKVMHGSRVRTAFSAERSEFSVAARAASAAASPADVLQAPPPLPRRDSAYRKLVQRVLLAGAEEAGEGECHWFVGWFVVWS